MRLIFGQTCRVLILAVAAVYWSGCAGPPQTDARPDAVAKQIKISEPRDVTTLREHVFSDWLPRLGRMDESTRRRHIPTVFGWTEVCAEGFDDVSSTVVPGWRIIGYPSLKPISLDGARGIELHGPQDMKIPCGFEYDLAPAQLAGKDLRLELRMSCRSKVRAAALDSIRISLLARDRAGYTSVCNLPLEKGVSPGWEWQRFWLRCRPDVGVARLQVLADRPGAILTLDAISLSAIDPLADDGSQPLLKSAAEQDSAEPPINLVADGDFETSSTRFFTSGISYWPNGEQRTVPLAWRFADNSAIGRQALALQVIDAVGRVGFGPFDMRGSATVGPDEARTWHLSFYARAERPTMMTVTLRTAAQKLGFATYEVSTEWQRFTARFAMTANTFHERLESASAELIFEFAGDEVPEINECLLDAVSLTVRPIDARWPYVRRSPVEIGLVGPADESAELSHLLDEKDTVSFGVTLVGNARISRQGVTAATRPATDATKTLPVGQLVIDVLDAWDRVVWSQTQSPVLPANGFYKEQVKLNLPRGFYRVLATLWSGHPGTSHMLSQDAISLGVIALQDSVPLGNYFGLSAYEGNASRLTTHLGAGWVRMTMPVRQLQIQPGLWDFSVWSDLMRRCEQGRIQVLVDVDLPQSPVQRELFVKAWLAENAQPPMGVLVRPPVIATRPAEEYREQMDWLQTSVAQQMPNTRFVRELTGLGDWPREQSASGAGQSDFVCGIASRSYVLPEESESYLEQIRQRKSSNTRVWDLGVSVQLGGMPDASVWPYRSANTQGVAPAASGVIEPLAAPIDPVRSASRMLRGILIRTLAGIRQVCCDATALSPVSSIFDDDRRRLHERDLSPRVALVVFDLAAELLNDATIERWVDVPGGSRVLLFVKDDGRAVAAIWRPFGLAPTRLGFEALPDSVELIDCVGQPEPAVIENGQRIVEVNEIVRYLIAPVDQQDALRKSLDTLRVIRGHSTRPTTRAVR